ncbi:MAG TPA: methylated-DNA--[protein]-cysteine S-methyltransferase, partial [Mycobacteriales bacterium]|nr:methylated-DNA--[protein]-cysteine S-methyltransferase [Mycobacteriales bacterium]
MSTRHTVLPSPIGDLTVVRDDDGITGVYFPHHWTRPDRATFGPLVQDGFEDVAAQLADYFAGTRRDFELPLHADGDAFQRQVWALLSAVPYGSTVTYGHLARVLGCTAREVGAAVGSNPLSILVGCHRVVGANGALTGYAGGLARKRHLL